MKDCSVILQHVIFPEQPELDDNRELFYKGTRGVVLGGELHLPKYADTEFYTYLNGFPNRKWKAYTCAKDIRLVLEISGACEILYAGYSISSYTPEKKSFGKATKGSTESETIKIAFPENDEQLLGFEIRCVGECILQKAWYETSVSDADIADVELSIATTTCRKEEFIKKNVKSLYENLIVREENIRNHLYVHIVDNGRTLNRSDFPEDERIFLHSNKNVGGSGGFARGMIESMRQTPEATNVLLMDDDVLILPESIYRTFMLLRLQKAEYKDAFINGAMLYYEDKDVQHEDIGTVTDRVWFVSEKPKFRMTNLTDVLANERWYPHATYRYGAWWYCCIPMTMIRKNGLPLPFFIRVDDVEYGTRCNPEIITMNGICIWHMGFENKYNSSFDLYQQTRNLFIAKATTGVLENIDLMRNYTHKLRAELMKFNYGAVELILRAMKDYLSGPEFISEDRGEAIMLENAKKNEQLRPMPEVTSDFVNLGEVFADIPRGKIKRLLYGITYNGQRLTPEFLLKDDPVAIPFNEAYTPSKIFWHKRLLATNPANRTAAMREMDKARFRKIMTENRQLMKYYKKHKDEIEQAYRNSREKLTSVEFWKRYLEI